MGKELKIFQYGKIETLNPNNKFQFCHIENFPREDGKKKYNNHTHRHRQSVPSLTLVGYYCQREFFPFINSTPHVSISLLLVTQQIMDDGGGVASSELFVVFLWEKWGRE
jgi:hypothetical protein